MDQIEDKKIVRFVKKGENDYFGYLMEKYSPRIHRYLRKFIYNQEDSEDVLQEVFLKAYININSFDENQNFSPWIYRIAHNEAINFLKKKKPEPFSLFDVDVLFPHPVAKEKTDDKTEKEIIKKMIDEVLEDISFKYKEVLVLYFYEDFSYKEISQMLKIPVTTVGVRISRGKEKVEEIFKQKGYKI